MRIHIICQQHGTTALVGRGTLLSELECVVCVRIQDEEYAASRRPCCSRANIDCCGHDEDQVTRPLFDVAVTLTSPGYCNDSLHTEAERFRRDQIELYRSRGEDYADATAFAAADVRDFLAVPF